MSATTAPAANITPLLEQSRWFITEVINNTAKNGQVFPPDEKMSLALVNNDTWRREALLWFGKMLEQDTGNRSFKLSSVNDNPNLWTAALNGTMPWIESLPDKLPALLERYFAEMQRDWRYIPFGNVVALSRNEGGNVMETTAVRHFFSQSLGCSADVMGPAYFNDRDAPQTVVCLRPVSTNKVSLLHLYQNVSNDLGLQVTWGTSP